MCVVFATTYIISTDTFAEKGVQLVESEKVTKYKTNPFPELSLVATKRLLALRSRNCGLGEALATLKPVLNSNN